MWASHFGEPADGAAVLLVVCIPAPILARSAFPAFLSILRLRVAGVCRKSNRWALAAGAILAILIYSYFYLWTAAAAWLFCFAVLWLVARADDRRAVAKNILIVASVSIAALVPYLYLLTQRAHTIDETRR